MKFLLAWGALLTLSLSAYSQCNSLKSALDQPRSVTSLDLTGCSLRDFPDDVLRLRNLKALYLGPSRLIMYRADAGSPVNGNLFRDLPEKFGKLRNLEVLNLQATDLRGLPESFTQLQALRVLDLSFNPRLDSTALFSILPQMEKLEKVNLTGCMLSPQTQRQLVEALPETGCVFNETQMIARD